MKSLTVSHTTFHLLCTCVHHGSAGLTDCTLPVFAHYCLFAPGWKGQLLNLGLQQSGTESACKALLKWSKSQAKNMSTHEGGNGQKMQLLVPDFQVSRLT